MARKKKSRLVNMEKSKPRRKSRSAEVANIDSDKYPWGLNLNLNEESIKKIPSVMNLKVGQEVMIIAKADVTEKRLSVEQTSKGGDRKDRSLTLQITDLQVAGDAKSEYDAAFDED